MNSRGGIPFSQAEASKRKRTNMQKNKSVWSYEFDLTNLSKDKAYTLCMDGSLVLLFVGIFICFALLASSVTDIKNILEN